MKKFILFAALSLAATLAVAEGGKNQEQNPLYDVSGNLIGVAMPVPDGCEVVIPQSGKAVYVICD